MLDLQEEPVLATIYTSYKPVEEYLQALKETGCSAPECIRPVDALVLDIFLSLLPSPAALADLSGAASYGVSTVLCRTQRRSAQVLGLSGSRGGAATPWLPVLEKYLAGFDASVLPAHREMHSARDVREAIGAGSEHSWKVVLLSAMTDRPESLCEKIRDLLDLGPGVAVVILALGETGECEQLASLCSAFSSASPERLMLIREQGIGFHDSRLGLIFRRSDVRLQDACSRLRQFFTSNYSFIELSRLASEAAVRIAALERELGHIRWAATRQTARRWFLRKTIRALEVYDSDGLRGLAGRVVKKLISTPAA